MARERRHIFDVVSHPAQLVFSMTSLSVFVSRLNRNRGMSSQSLDVFQDTLVLYKGNVLHASLRALTGDPDAVNRCLRREPCCLSV